MISSSPISVSSSSSVSCDKVVPFVLSSVGAKDRVATKTKASSSTAIEVNSLKSKAGEFRSGRWTLDEKILFLYGLNKFGKGRWKKISIYLPNRSLVQIKSHAQKVLKRQEAGENVYRRMEENQKQLEILVAEAHARAKIAETDRCPKNKSKRKRGASGCAAGKKRSNNNINKNDVDNTTTPAQPIHPISPESKKTKIEVALCTSSSNSTLQEKVQGQAQEKTQSCNADVCREKVPKALFLDTDSESSQIEKRIKCESGITDNKDFGFDAESADRYLFGFLQDEKTSLLNDDYNDAEEWKNLLQLLEEPFDSDQDDNIDWM